MDDKCETCCARHKHREDAQYRSLITRLNRIEGQVRGVRNIVEDIQKGNLEVVDELCHTIKKLMK